MFLRKQFFRKLLYGGIFMQSQFVNHQILGNVIYEQCVNKACCQYDMIKTEMDILLFLYNNPGYDTATDIVKHRHLSKSHVSKSIQSLKERGYLTAFYQGSNRRTIHLKLCDAARPAVMEGLKAQERFVSILLADFTEEEKTQFQKYLCRIINNMQKNFQ